MGQKIPLKVQLFSTGFCQSSVSGGTWYTKNGVPINEYIQKEENGKNFFQRNLKITMKLNQKKCVENVEDNLNW